RVGETGGRRAMQPDVVEELGELERPRLVAAGKLPRRRLGRAHFRQHLVERDALDAVTAAQAVDLYLRGLAVDLEREQVLPFRAAHVQEGRAIGRRAEQQ